MRGCLYLNSLFIDVGRAVLPVKLVAQVELKMFKEVCMEKFMPDNFFYIILATCAWLF